MDIKNDMVRLGNSMKEVKFWRRDSFTVTNDFKYLSRHEAHEVKDRLEKLKELCKYI